MSKIIAKELETQNNAQTNKQVDNNKIKSHAMCLLKKDMPITRNGTANPSVTSENIDTT